MNYSVVSSVNGNFKIEGEYGSDFQSAVVAYHQKCAAFWNASDVYKATIKVVDENFDVVDGKMEQVFHDGPEEV